MKFVYEDMGHVLLFDGSCVNELVIENKKMFFDMVNTMSAQVDGMHGKCILSIYDKSVEFGRYADLTIQFAPFELNRKSLVTKLCSAIEQKAMFAENYVKTRNLLGDIERYIFDIAEEFPFDVNCKKLSIGTVIKAVSPEIDESEKSTLEKIFTYMELVRELDRDKLFIMINMRTYFSDSDMELFCESAALHEFRVLLIENTGGIKLNNTKRYTIDEDLCEF